MSIYYIVRRIIVCVPIDVVGGRFATEVLATDPPLRLRGFEFIYPVGEHMLLKILECRNRRRRNYYSIRYGNGLFPTDVLAVDLHPAHEGVSRTC